VPAAQCIGTSLCLGESPRGCLGTSGTPRQGEGTLQLPAALLGGQSLCCAVEGSRFGGGSPKHRVHPDGFGEGCSYKQELLGGCVPVGLSPKESLKPLSIISL